MSAKVFTTAPGHEIRIDRYGLATNTTPAIVPDEVATGLEEEIAGERPNPLAGQEGEPAMLRFGSGPRLDIRVERDVASIAAGGQTFTQPDPARRPTRVMQAPPPAAPPASEEKKD